ncbi:hypothetical protein Q604_UNBC17602G0001, partial [human gut metagenome]
SVLVNPFLNFFFSHGYPNDIDIMFITAKTITCIAILIPKDAHMAAAMDPALSNTKQKLLDNISITGI